MNSEPTEFVGTVWYLTDVVSGGRSVPVTSPGAASMRVGAGRAEIHYGCNGGTAALTFGAGTIDFERSTTTLVACSQANSIQIEGSMKHVLMGTVSYHLDGSTLTLTAPDGSRLIFTDRLTISSSAAGLPPSASSRGPAAIRPSAAETTSTAGPVGVPSHRSPGAALLTGHYQSVSATGPGVPTGTAFEVWVDSDRIEFIVGCTGYASRPIWTASTLRLPDIVPEDYSCNQTERQQEWFLGWIAKGLAVSGTVDSPTLTAGGDAVLLSRVQATPLDGATWWVTSVVAADGVGVPPATRASLRFYPGLGKAVLNSSCSGGGALFTVIGSTIGISKMAASHCSKTDATAVDFTAFFAHPATFQITGDTLTLTSTAGTRLICTATSP